MTITAEGMIAGEPLNEAQVKTASGWLDQFATPAKRARFGVGSYGLKHEMESWGRRVGLEPYISNGAAIEAVRRKGWPIAVRVDAQQYRNAVLGMRKKRQ